MHLQFSRKFGERNQVTIFGFSLGYTLFCTILSQYNYIWGSFRNFIEDSATGIYVLMQKTSKGDVSKWFTVLDMISLHPFFYLLCYLLKQGSRDRGGLQEAAAQQGLGLFLLTNGCTKSGKFLSFEAFHIGTVN